MNVLMYCLSSVSGGAISYLRNLSPQLSRLFQNSRDGHELKFLVHTEQRDLFNAIDDCQFLWIEGKRPQGYHRVIWELLNIARIVRQEKIDVLFTPYQIGPRASGLRHVLMLRNMEPFLYSEYKYGLASLLRNNILRMTSNLLLAKADRVIAVSNFARQYLVDNHVADENEIHTVYHGCNVKYHSADKCKINKDSYSRLGIRSRFILTCGSLLPYRRCEDVITAFDQSAKHLPYDVQLVIAGAGTDRRYGDLISQSIASSPYRERILAVGHVPWETMWELYRQCLLCVIATEIEACPNIAIEAMAAGCAIISSDRPPLPEMFQGASLEYHARDIGNLARLMQHAIDDADLRTDLKVRSLKRAENFSWDKCAQQTYAALTQWN